MKPDLKVVAGTDVPERKRIVTGPRIGLAMICSAGAAWGYIVATSRYQALLLGATCWMAMVVGWKLWRQAVEAKDDALVVHHYHRRSLF